jgi:hypothetical protein
MKMLALAVAVSSVAFVTGCGKKLDDPVDLDSAGAVLQTVFDAWKQGEDPGDLQKRNPPLYFNEPEWKAGTKLLDFKAGKVELMGRQGRCSVQLSLRDRQGKETKREISDLIDTTPRVAIVRENLGL